MALDFIPQIDLDVILYMQFLFIAEWSATYASSTFYELHLRRTPKEKENNITIRTKLNTH